MLEKLKFSSVSVDRNLDLKDAINVRGMLPSNKNFQTNDVDVETNLRNAESTNKVKQVTKLDMDDENEGKDYRNFSFHFSIELGPLIKALSKILKQIL